MTNGILRVELGDNASGNVVADGVRIIPLRPTTSGIPDVTVNEDASNTVIPLFDYFEAAQTVDAGLTFTVQGNTNAALFASVGIAPANGQLTLDYAPNASGVADITIRATDASGRYVEDTFRVTLNALADGPSLSVAPASGNENTAIPLTITSSLTDADGSEALSVTIAGVPAGAALSAGTNNGSGSWTLTGSQLVGLTITPPVDSDADFTLTVTATATESSNGGTSATSASLAVTVNAVNAAAPTLVPQAGNPGFFGIPDMDVNEDDPPTNLTDPTDSPGFAPPQEVLLRRLWKYFTDAGQDSKTLQYEIVEVVGGDTSGGDLFDSVTLDPTTNGLLRIDLADDAYGNADITVRATNALGLSVLSTFKVTIHSINDFPEVEEGIGDIEWEEDDIEEDERYIDVYPVFEDVEDLDDELTYTIENDNPNVEKSNTPFADTKGIWDHTHGCKDE